MERASQRRRLVKQLASVTNPPLQLRIGWYPWGFEQAESVDRCRLDSGMTMINRTMKQEGLGSIRITYRAGTLELRCKLLVHVDLHLTSTILGTVSLD
jgi:hypothetical protein